MIVVLQASNESTLAGLRSTAKRTGVATHPVRDYGLTELQNGTWTALAIGPEEVERVDAVSGRLELLRDTHEERELRRRIAELEVASGAAEASKPKGDVVLVRTLDAYRDTAVVPDFFEQWCWEGDRSVLPHKWLQAVDECCGGRVGADALRPWEAQGFDEQGIFFITSRSDTCGIALALPAGEDPRTGTIGAWGVEASYRRRGLGRCLLRFCLQRHAELGRTRVLCTVSPVASPEAFQLLQQEGFLPVTGGR